MKRKSVAKAQRALPDAISRQLLQRIERGSLAPGGALPSERQLCETFGVSRTVVREALAHLRSDGLITAHQGKGAFVATRGQRHSFRLDEVALDEKAAQGHILELLIAVEVAATRLAAERRTPNELERIRGALIGMEDAIAQNRLGDAEDYAFHQAIVDATHNPHFQALNEYLENKVRRLIRQARSNTARNYAGLVRAVQQEHQAIYDAIAAGDGAAAGRAADTHLRNAGKRLGRYLNGAERARA